VPESANHADCQNPTPVLQVPDDVLVSVASVGGAAGWHSSVLRLPADFLDENFATIRIGSARLCFDAADARVPAGRAGQVAYWRVASLGGASARFLAAGAELYRGPLAIDSTQGICQFADPFGNLFGLIGPYDGA